MRKYDKLSVAKQLRQGNICKNNLKKNQSHIFKDYKFQSRKYGHATVNGNCFKE